jgi:hypothetical protein
MAGLREREPGGVESQQAHAELGPAGTKGQGTQWSGMVVLWAYGAGAWWASCSLNKSWCGEAFHKPWVQSAELSTIPGALPQPSMFPESPQGP